ncbi:hypothetical protein B0I37DRAFT_369792 [Chaetomium sp. MPI-CAGE-AT-0009]|nr:hypothetical protein B0I37DRAFT_369792 [Chaetomium sp. MPI-CAGE-AT-0009]
MAHPLVAAPCYTFAVDIEARAEPHKIRSPLHEKHALYHGKLAAALRNRGLEANAADNSSSRRADGDNGWWITSNSSLGVPPDTVPIEAVSPALDIRADWGAEIDTFWSALRAVFHMPERSELCGSHVHVARSRVERFTLSQLKTIAYAAVVYEPSVTELLVASRRESTYCKPNTRSSDYLYRVGVDPRAVAELIGGARDEEELRNMMQGSRHVLWNFDGVLPGGSGAVEFRGGRSLRGELRTKRWMAFAVSFIHAMLQQNELYDPSPDGLRLHTTEILYAEIRMAAVEMDMQDHLPVNYERFNETLKE